LLVYPVSPQLARLEDKLPTGPDWVYEPKWDGFRCVLFKRGPSIRLQSRNGRDLARSFPEVSAALHGLPECVLDGELVAAKEGRQDFELLLERLAGQRNGQVAYVAFDALEVEAVDLRNQPFAERRRLLQSLASMPNLALTLQTEDASTAELWLSESFTLGFEGVVAKRLSLPYQAGERCLVKVKHFESVDVVVGGYTGGPDDPRGLIVGLYDEDGTLHHVGTTSIMPRRVRAEAAALRRSENAFGGLQPGRSRWPSHQFEEWTPVEPSTVCEVRFSRLDGMWFRHSVRFVRWRPDLDPSGCTYAQLERFRGRPD
jgi:ATP-dependent DNA ligase